MSSLIQSRENTFSSVTSASLAFNAGNVGSDRLVLLFIGFQSTETPGTVVPSGNGLTWQSAKAQSNNGIRFEICWAINPSSQALTPGASWDNAANGTIIIAECDVTGVGDIEQVLASTDSLGIGSETTAHSCSSGGVAGQADDVMVSGGVLDGTPGTPGLAAGTNWTQIRTAGRAHAQIRLPTGAVSGDIAPFTSTNSRRSANVVTVFRRVAIDGAHLASGAQLFTGTVGQALAGVHLASTAQLFAGTVTAERDVEGAHLASGAQLFAGAASADDTIAGAHLASGAELFPGALSLELLGAHVSSTAQMFAGAVGHGLAGAHVTSTAQTFAGAVSLDVEGAHLASTASLFPGSLAAPGTVTGAHLASTAQLFAGAATLTLSGGHIPSGAALFSGAVAIDVSGAFVASSASLFAGVVHQPDLGGTTIPSAAALFAGAIATGVTITEAHGRASYQDTVRGRGSYRDSARGRASYQDTVRGRASF